MNGGDPAASAKPPGARSSPRWPIALKTLITLALAGWIVRQLNTGAFVSALSALTFGVVAGAAALILLQQGVLAWRWQRIVRHMGGDWSFPDAARWTFVGILANQLLPTSVGGDAIRIWALNRHGRSLSIAASSVAVERGTGLVVLALIVAAATASSLPVMTAGGIAQPLLTGSLALTLGLVGLCLVDRPLARCLPRAAGHAVLELTRSVRRLFGSPAAALEVFVGGLVASGLGLWSAVVLARGLGIDLDAGAITAVVGGTVLLSLAPVSLGGWGVREAGMLALFGQMAVPSDQAVALSIVWSALPIATALPGGLYGLLQWRKQAGHDDTTQTRSGRPIAGRPDSP